LLNTLQDWVGIPDCVDLIEQSLVNPL